MATLTTIQVAKLIPSQQMFWLKAIEKRVSATTSIISAMKEIKLLGTVPLWLSKIREWMRTEVSGSQKMRTTVAWMSAGG